MRLLFLCLCSFFWTILSPMASFAAAGDEPYSRWSLSKAVGILNSSPWARQETFTRVVGGVGSGVAGEKEIYNTFYIRFLSARPVREAYARIQQIQHGYDDMLSDEKEEFDRVTRSTLELDAGNWIVVALGFRSNDPNEESRVREFFESQTTRTLKNRAFLSTESFPQVEVTSYFAPLESSVGAKFVFPRQVDGQPLISSESKNLTFELLEVPGAWSGRSSGDDDDDDSGPSNRTEEPGSRLRATFGVDKMIIDGETVF